MSAGVRRGATGLTLLGLGGLIGLYWLSFFWVSTEASQGIAAGDPIPLREAAHAIAGNCGRFGGEVLQQEARALMELCETEPSKALVEGPLFVGSARSFMAYLDELADTTSVPEPSSERTG